MATLEQLEVALRNAAASGNSEAARRISEEYKRERDRQASGGVTEQNAEQEYIKTTPSGLAGAVTRGLAPYGIAAAGGAAAGAPFGGVGAIPGAAAGVTAAALEELGGFAYNTLANATGLPRYTTFRDVVNQGLTNVGIETPNTPSERILEAVSAGAGGGTTFPRSLSTLANANTFRGLPSEIAQTMSQMPTRQGVAGGLSGATSGTLNEVPEGQLGFAEPVVRPALPFIAGALPFLARGGAATVPASQAIEAGYSIPPTQISRDPAILARILESAGGRSDVEAAASIRNQPVTNRLAAEELKINGDVTSSKIADTRQQYGRIYNEVRNLPASDNINLPEYQTKLSDVFSNANTIKQEFPDLFDNEFQRIINAAESFIPNQTSSDALVSASSRLREMAATNFKNDNNDIARLQSQIANAFEEILAGRAESTNPDLVNSWNNARTYIAKSHILENAFNSTTGNFDARVIGRASERTPGVFTGGLRTIGQMGAAFPSAASTTARYPSLLPQLSGSDAILASGLTAGAVSEAISPQTAVLIGLLSRFSGPTARTAALSPAYQSTQAGMAARGPADYARILSASMPGYIEGNKQ